MGNVHSKVKRYRKQHKFTKEEQNHIARGPYDNLLNLVYSQCMEFMKSYNEFPWKLKHHERLTNLNQIYKELRSAEDRWKKYYKNHVDDIPNDIEINMAREIRK